MQGLNLSLISGFMSSFKKNSFIKSFYSFSNQKFEIFQLLLIILLNHQIKLAEPFQSYKDLNFHHDLCKKSINKLSHE